MLRRRPWGANAPGQLWRKQEKHHAGIENDYTVFSKTHARVINVLAKRRKGVYNVHRCGIESRCVGGRFACAGYGEFAPPHSRRVDLVLLKINDIFDSCTSFAGCVF